MAAIDFDITKTKVMDAPRDSTIGKAILSMLGEGPWDDALAPAVNVVIANTGSALILNADTGSISGGSPDYQTRMCQKGDGGSDDPTAALSDAIYDAAMETDSGLLTIRLLPADNAGGTPLTVSPSTFKAFTADDDDDAASAPAPVVTPVDATIPVMVEPEPTDTSNAPAAAAAAAPAGTADPKATTRMCPAYAPGDAGTSVPVASDDAASAYETGTDGQTVANVPAANEVPSIDATKTYENVLAIANALADGGDTDSAVALLYSGISVLEANYAMGDLTDAQHDDEKEKIEQMLGSLGYSTATIPDGAGNVPESSPVSQVAAAGEAIPAATDPGDVSASMPPGVTGSPQGDIDAIDTLLSLD